ncbi:head-tail adaptor protein [Henriciella aquimarina]|uniref:head-tail adaptor protein n=1 Tax=Henriciella aquimarina TaxID=545261 RepID=UPI000A0530B6|nr:head-tail adaptor protein [Henriciella aquimarina]
MSGLLGGDLQEVFGSVFAPLLLDATITKVTLTDDGYGGFTETEQTAAAKGMVEAYSAYTRAQANIPSTDVKLIILQKDVAISPDLDSKITIRGQDYSIQAIEEDPAQAAWTIQGRPTNG